MKTFIDEMYHLKNRGKKFLYASVTQKGDVLVKEWFDVGPDLKSSLFPVYSVSKTVTALLVGILMTQKRIRSVEEHLDKWLPSALTESLTIEHLLTMTAGWLWPESETFGQPNGIFKQFLESKDPVNFVLQQPREHRPGEAFVYNSGISHLLMYIVGQCAQIPGSEFAQKYLWDPLDIGKSEVNWALDAQGNPFGGHGLSLSIQGIETLGTLLESMGMYKGHRIVDLEYMKALTATQVKNTRGHQGYGYQTWKGSIEGQDFFAAFGHGGQRIYVFPKIKLKAVFLGRHIQPEFGLQERLLKGLFKRLNFRDILG